MMPNFKLTQILPILYGDILFLRQTGTMYMYFELEEKNKVKVKLLALAKLLRVLGLVIVQFYFVSN